MDVWCPFASRSWTAKGSGPHVAGPWRGVLHTTEGSTAAGALATYQSTGDYPHFTVSESVIEQHCPIDVGATALKHPDGTVDTNRLSAVQIEIVGFAAMAPKFSDPLFLNLARVMRWVEAQTGITFDGPPAFTATSASTAPRMSVETWRRFNSWCGHEHVPNNDHWDPGQLSIDKLAPLKAAVLTPTIQEDEEDMSKFVHEYRWEGVQGAPVVKIDAQGRAYCYGLTYRGGVDLVEAAGKLNWHDGEGTVSPVDINNPEAGYRIFSEDSTFKGDFTPGWAAAHLR